MSFTLMYPQKVTPIGSFHKVSKYLIKFRNTGSPTGQPTKNEIYKSWIASKRDKALNAMFKNMKVRPRDSSCVAW